MFKLSKGSLDKLEGVHPDLVKVVKRAIEVTKEDFSVLEGLRTKERQRRLVSEGKSQTMNSRHLTGHAVDLVPYPINWEWSGFFPIADAMIKASQELNIPLRWGGNWQKSDLRSWGRSAVELHRTYTGNFPDGPHFELPREFY